MSGAAVVDVEASTKPKEQADKPSSTKQQEEQDATANTEQPAAATTANTTPDTTAAVVAAPPPTDNEEGRGTTQKKESPSSSPIASPTSPSRRRVTIAEAIQQDQSINHRPGDDTGDDDDDDIPGVSPIAKRERDEHDISNALVDEDGSSQRSPTAELAAVENISDFSKRLLMTQSFVMVPGVTSRKHSRANLNKRRQTTHTNDDLTSNGSDDNLNGSDIMSNGTFTSAGSFTLTSPPEGIMRVESMFSIENPAKALSWMGKLDRKETANREKIFAYQFNHMFTNCYYPLLHHLRLHMLSAYLEKKLAHLQRSQEYWWRLGFIAEEAISRCELAEAFYRTKLVAERTHNIRQYIKHQTEMLDFMKAHELQKERLVIERQYVRERRMILRERDSGNQWMLLGFFITKHRILGELSMGYMDLLHDGVHLQRDEYAARMLIEAQEEIDARRELLDAYAEGVISLFAKREIARGYHMLVTSESRGKAQELLARVARGLFERQVFFAQIGPRKREESVRLLHCVAKAFFIRRFVYYKSQRNIFVK